METVRLILISSGLRFVCIRRQDDGLRNRGDVAFEQP
jgi:hypothetical protein